jgi:hypothetical protein
VLLEGDHVVAVAGLAGDPAGPGPGERAGRLALPLPAAGNLPETVHPGRITEDDQAVLR